LGVVAQKAGILIRVHWRLFVVRWILLLCIAGCATPEMKPSFQNYRLDYETPIDAPLQARLVAIDTRLRAKYGMTTEQTAAGILDLRGLRLAMIHPDRMDYAASVPKIGILLAYFQLHPEAATNLAAQTREELGAMIKVSSNEMAAKYSRALGLKRIQQVLDSYEFYDAKHGGGIWIGKHYGLATERYGDPVANHSHAATVRQLLRFYLLLEQGKLVSPAASKTMRSIFDSPDVPHRNDKFVKSLAGRDLQILRKSGWWEDWFHDTAIVTGAGRHYIIAAMTHHRKGDAYLEEFAQAVDDLLAELTERLPPRPFAEKR
jgi:beta-lactamase class A